MNSEAWQVSVIEMKTKTLNEIKNDLLGDELNDW